MGRSIALTLAREGARVVVNYRTNQTAAEAVVSAIANLGGQAAAIRADVFTTEGCQHLVSASQAHFR